LMFSVTPLLVDDFSFLSEQFQKRWLAPVIFTVGLLLLPALIFINMSFQKQTLGKALTYIYEPSYLETQPDININHIETLLEEINSVKTATESDWGFSESVPFISPFYKWYVLENLTLSSDKVNSLEKLFLPQSVYSQDQFRSRGRVRTPMNNQSNANPFLTNYEIEQGVDENGATKSWVHFEIANPESNVRMTEFTTAFTLPTDVYISDYYLDIFGVRKQGILSERKSALWVYQQITTVERRDPGLLFYGDTPDELLFRIFPFSSGETRTTGIEFIHTDTLRFTFDSKEIVIPPVVTNIPAIYEDQNQLGVVISASGIEDLETVNRAVKPLFILDYSEGAESYSNRYRPQIISVLNKLSLNNTPFDVVCANYKSEQFDNETWELGHTTVAFEGGFELSYPIKQALLENYLSDEGYYRPIFVLSPNLDEALVNTKFTDWGVTFPEGPEFYYVSSENNTSVHSLYSPEEIIKEIPIGAIDLIQPVKILSGFSGTSYFIADESVSVVVPYKSAITNNLAIGIDSVSSWENGVTIDLMETILELNPTDRDEKWLAIIQNSFATNILSSHTSFISLENEAQEQALFKMQERVLLSSSNLDVADENHMPEPPLWIMMILVVLLMKFKKKSVVGQK